MKNEKNKTILFQISSIIILIAALMWQFKPVLASYVMIVGVSGFAGIIFTTPYPGNSLRGKRLFNIQVFAVLLMIVATYLMYAQMKAWVVVMLISALLTLYCSYLLPKAYKTEQEEKDK